MTTLSVVIPARNEGENIAALVRAIDAALQAHQPFEIIVVDDGSTDDTAARVRAMALAHVRARLNGTYPATCSPSGP